MRDLKLVFNVVTSNNIFINKEYFNKAFLVIDDWDDWFTYQTAYFLYVFDKNGVMHSLGQVKIGEKGLEKGRPDLPNKFESLSDVFFSLGQEKEYYEQLYKLDKLLQNIILNSLNDIVKDQEKYSIIVDEDVSRVSLFRSVSPSSVRGQFWRLLHGYSKLTKYHFKYSIQQTKRIGGYEIDFKVSPNSCPLSNVHVLIGRNGVGKTFLLNNMVQAIVDDEAEEKDVGSFEDLNNKRIIEKELFGGVISVSFSAFDPFDPLTEKESLKKGVRYSYIGLKRENNRGGKRGTPKSHDMLVNEFSKCLSNCVKLEKYEQWLSAIEMLETDPLFADIGLKKRLKNLKGENLENEAKLTFKRMSSGHSVVLLTITKLIEKVEEKTLVLIDEPECHLHPPLLSSFIRTLTDVLSHKNAVAIVATHSPVILQEVPRSCVWKLNRVSVQANAKRPTKETFGENISVLTSEVFGLEVTTSGYHQLLSRAINENNNYEDVLEYFDGQLGSEARGIARGLMAIKKQGDE